ncbi:MAG TPA: hypothetical protein VKB69_14760 [Micromonosporaceae bacterium]|nr:hypothetical protein [Micromonosporaceae bacterium]
MPPGARRVVSAAIGILTLAAAGGCASATRQRTATVATSVRTCTVTDPPTVLTVPSGGGDVVVDPSGRYVAANNVLWSDGRAQVIPAPHFQAIAVNAQGVVIGHDLDGSYVYRAGTVAKLPGITGSLSNDMAAFGIDSAGDIAGYAYLDREPFLVPVIWPAGGAAPYELAIPSATGQSSVLAMGADGTAVGYASDGTAPDGHYNYPYVWMPDGTGHRLAMPGGMSAGGAMAASGDWVVGWVAADPMGDGPREEVRWNLRTGDVTRYPGNPGAFRSVVDSAGDVVIIGFGPDTGGAYVFRDGRRIPLPLPPGADPKEYTATSISADGGVIGGVRVETPDGLHTTSLIWRC